MEEEGRESGGAGETHCLPVGLFVKIAMSTTGDS